MRWSLAATAVAIGLIAQRQAGADDLFVSSAAVDQPRINISFAPFGDPTNPFVGPGFDLDGNEIPTIQINAFWDTGASGIVLSEGTADLLEMARYEIGGSNVVFNDVSPGGTTPFHVSEQIVMRLAPSLGFMDNEEPYFSSFSGPENFLTAYEATGPAPARVQIGPVGSVDDINVAGMPTMIGRKVVFDPRPTDNFITLIDDDPDNDNFDSFVRAYSYDASHPLGSVPPGSSDMLLNPGIPPQTFPSRSATPISAGSRRSIPPPPIRRPRRTTHSWAPTRWTARSRAMARRRSCAAALWRWKARGFSTAAPPRASFPR